MKFCLNTESEVSVNDENGSLMLRQVERFIVSKVDTWKIWELIFPAARLIENKIYKSRQDTNLLLHSRAWRITAEDMSKLKEILNERDYIRTDYD